MIENIGILEGCSQDLVSTRNLTICCVSPENWGVASGAKAANHSEADYTAARSLRLQSLQSSKKNIRKGYSQ